MDSETIFYIVGGALVVIALAVSAIGMRNDDFPSPAMLRGGVALAAIVVAVTATTAVLSARAEQQHREDEENIEAAAAEEEQTAANEEAGAAQPETPENAGQGPQDAGPEPTEDGGQAGGGGGAPAASGDAGAGAAVFADNGCGNCHTLSAAGSQAVGEIGPNLDEALVDMDAAFIETSIVDPSAEVAEGYGDGIMPATFADEIAPEDLKNLVAYLSESTSGGN